MNLLVDTHIWLWWMELNPDLPKSAYALINDPDNRVLVSSISLWEVVIKVQAGKLRVQGNLAGDSITRGLEFLPFVHPHAETVADLTFHHKDPFDRGLLAQARFEKLRFLTSDKALAKYRPEVDVVIV